MKIFSLILFSLVLSGCGLFGARIEDRRPDAVNTTHTTILGYTCPQPPQLDTFRSRPVDWDVISRKELDAEMLALMDELDVEEDVMFIINQATGDFFFLPEEEVIWALSADDYADLGRNTSDILAAMKQQKEVIRHYKQCITDSEQIVLDANRRETENNTEQ